jgi:hypothetical protein
MDNSFMEGIDPVFEKAILTLVKKLIDTISDVMDESYQENFNKIKDNFLKLYCQI